MVIRKDFETVLHYVYCGIGTINAFEYTVQEREAVPDHLPEYPLYTRNLPTPIFVMVILTKPRRHYIVPKI